MSQCRKEILGSIVRPTMATLLPSLLGMASEGTPTGYGGTRWRSFLPSTMEKTTMEVHIDTGYHSVELSLSLPADPATVAYQRPLKQPYVMRSLDWPTDVSMSQVPVSQPFWWEVLAQAKPYPEIVTVIVGLVRLPTVKVIILTLILSDQ